MIGKTIRNARNAMGMTTRELAQKASVTQNMIYRYESGKAKPTLEVRARLFKALEIENKTVSKELLDSAVISRNYDTTVAKGRLLDDETKWIITHVVNSYLRNSEMKALVANLHS